jgi:hypothetical protein
MVLSAMTFMRLSITIKNATQGALVIVMLSVVMLSVANKTLILSVVMLSVVMPSVVAPLYMLVTYPSKM